MLTLDTKIKLNADTPADRANERVKADPSTWTSFADIQPIDAWLLIGKIKEASEKATAAGTGVKPKKAATGKG